MKAMILAAGRGERMRPLTDTTPKPLICVNGKPLIEYHIEKLVAAGVTDIVINLAWLGEKIKHYLGDGSRWQANIFYSDEQQEGALETAGGIIKALPLLTSSAEITQESGFFLVINGDVFTEFNYENIVEVANTLKANNNRAANAHLWLINNPAHNPTGDFSLSEKGLLANIDGASYTFSGIGLYHADFFVKEVVQESAQGKVHALGPMLRAGAEAGTISAELMNDYWQDVGTPERLAELNERLQG